MYITEDQLKARLKGKTKVPTEVKVLAALLSQDDTQQNVADALGISQTTVSQGNRGLVDSRLDKDLRDQVKSAVDEKLDKVQNLALDALVDSLTSVKENARGLNAKDAATVANKMSNILGNMTPKNGNYEGGSGDRRVLIIVPAMKKEEDYEAITV